MVERLILKLREFKCGAYFRPKIRGLLCSVFQFLALLGRFLGLLWLGLRGGADPNQAGPEVGVGTHTSRELCRDAFSCAHELSCRLVSFPVQYLEVEGTNRKSLRPNRSGEEEGRRSSTPTPQCRWSEIGLLRSSILSQLSTKSLKCVKGPPCETRARLTVTCRVC